MWNADREALEGNVERVRAFAGLGSDRRPLGFRAALAALAAAPDFADWLSAQLAASRFEAFFWELPAFDVGHLDHPFEFVLIEAPALARSRADARAFRDAFREPAARRTGAVATFANLGGDAQLVAPRPLVAPDAYTHLARFVREAPAFQQRAFWQAVALACEDSLGDGPRWLSTSGLGVAWLHARIDSTPKYFQHEPYRRSPERRTADAVED